MTVMSPRAKLVTLSVNVNVTGIGDVLVDNELVEVTATVGGVIS